LINLFILRNNGVEKFVDNYITGVIDLKTLFVIVHPE
jgi:hypothetical protein